MKSVKHIALSALLTVGAFGTVLYTSCTKDECKDVVCQNGGTCSEGKCTCPTGVGGTNCGTIFRTTYANTYVGNGVDNEGDTYTNWRAKFTATGTDLTKMEMQLQDATGAPVVTLPIVLSDIKESGSVFTITSTSQLGATYTGTGTITGSICSISLNEKENGGTGNIVYTFTNMAKQ